MASTPTSTTTAGSGPLLRFEVLRRLAKLILPTYRFKWPQMAWWDDPWFNAYLDQFGERGGMNTDRKWMLYQLMRTVVDVAGDTAECGVYEGASSYLMCSLNAQHAKDRTHLVFDSFEGLSEPSVRDGGHWKQGDLSVAEDTVRRNLSPFSRVEYFKGWIPSRFSEVADRHFAFVHIDVDIHQPTLDSLVFFYPRMRDGGIILCDDYGFTSCPGATEAFDQYLADKPEKMIALCSGGGYLVKGMRVAGPLQANC